MSVISVAFSRIRRSCVLPAARALSYAVPLVLACAVVGLLVGAQPAEAMTPKQRERLEAPVKAVADQRVIIDTPQGSAVLPVYADHPLDQAVPDVVRVFIVIHGTLRNADAYYASGHQVVEKAGAAGAGTMVVAPQFLTRADVRAFSLPASTLAWTQEGWKGGEPARQPAPVSSFAALDALLAHFADRRLYPSLSTVVVIGHSAGAQLLQRYAVAGREGDALARTGIAVRYVVANPSSYLYFDDERPNADALAGGACPRATEWKYGLKSAPPYVASQDVRDLETRYVARRVVYLLGQADTNPYTHFIDRSCAAMAQGPYRLARGLAYFDYLKKRHPDDLAQQVVEVPGVGHDGLGMFTSVCGLAVLFGQALPQSCPVVAGTAPELRAAGR
ncbi:alpha/beta fold hydrolase [Burkholderia cenocepacia]|uniref:alpha/beta fold hydrolase n=1 Tax=Burkholderia cenocepacia TaxID=95486 RepID=UPI000F55D7D8|nr:alpha/beta fold hydrolase [Burkholderia cenocepacia]MCA8082775.1 alpha/beta fold hydrolase [Burkholderia cenocepacia]RQU31856.1 alpha/beta fold hydrolase [Burkholderia cenocepacia]RQU60786.1 alpha/beta fold hydrolase [Burkholderia cenocepacia]RQU96710.1 alpha/beta fold hydrolase [Burkholderia cenocepacia]